MAKFAPTRQTTQLSERDVDYIARLYGLWIEKSDIPEVTSRLNALLEEVEKLNDLDLSRIEPIPVFLKEND